MSKADPKNDVVPLGAPLKPPEFRVARFTPSFGIASTAHFEAIACLLWLCGCRQQPHPGGPKDSRCFGYGEDSNENHDRDGELPPFLGLVLWMDRIQFRHQYAMALVHRSGHVSSCNHHVVDDYGKAHKRSVFCHEM